MIYYRILIALLASIQFLYGDVLIGKLENGLTYYIQHNEFPVEKASLQLIVKVGSIYETEEERGLAHFLEHMVFRGSENFSDYEVVRYLESIGAEFGADTNAYTTFEETSYHLNVPLEKEDSLDKAILMLSDFAGRALLQEDLIEKERTVVMDEFNRSQNDSNSRIYNQVYSEFFNNSSYANRMPIGLKEVILKADPSILKNFYKKWYRPNRMAIIAVGDFDVSELEKTIKECFGDLEKGDETIISTEVLFPMDVRSLFMVDKEQMFVQGSYAKFYGGEGSYVVCDEQVKSNIISSIAAFILNNRLDCLSKEHPAPYLYAGMFSQALTSFHEMLRFHYIGFMERPIDGLKTLFREIERLKKFGATKPEIEGAIAKLSEILISRSDNLDRISNEQFVGSYRNHFLMGIPLKAVEEVFELKARLIKEIQCEDIALWMQNYIQLEDMHRIFSMPFVGTITASDVDQAFLDIKDEELKPYEDRLDTPLEVIVGEPAKVSSSLFNEEFGWTKLTLDNGIEIVFHPTKLEKGRIFIDLVADFGKTLFKPEEYASSVLASEYLIASGLANLDGSELKSFLQKRDCTLEIAIKPNSRMISSSGPTSEAEGLFQTIRALFLDKRFSGVVWNSLKEQVSEIEKYKNHSPEAYFYEDANQVIYNNHPFYIEAKNDDAKEELAKKCLEVAFSDPREFAIVVVGDFDVSQMKEIALKYFNWQMDERIQNSKPQLPSLANVAEPIEKILYRGMNTHGTTIIGYRKNCRSETPIGLSMKVLSHILTERCFKKMRQELGDTYSVQLNYEFPLEPYLGCIFAYFQYSSTPEKAEGLRQIALEVVNDFLLNGVTTEEVGVAKAIIFQRIKDAKLTDRFWTNLHVHSLLSDKSLDEILLEKEDLDYLTPDTIHQFGKELFDGTPAIRLSLFREGASIRDL